MAAHKPAFLVAAMLLTAVPVHAEPVENGTEIAALLEELGDRCWAIDPDGQIFDAAALSQITGPIDIELECIVAETAEIREKSLPATSI